MFHSGADAPPSSWPATKVKDAKRKPGKEAESVLNWRSESRRP